MLLFKSLFVSMTYGGSILRFGRAIVPKNHTSNRFPHCRNLIIFRQESSKVQTEETNLTANSNELAEDLLGEEIPEIVTDTTANIFREIAAGDPEVEKQLKLLEFEVAVLREGESRVPDKMTKQNWLDLWQLNSHTKRKKFLAFLRLNELKSISEKQKVLGKRLLWERYKKEHGFHYYGLSGHSMFMRVYEKNINRLLNLRLWNAKLRIILDCSYQEYMSLINLKACAKQIFYCFSDARLHRYPCQLEICNLDREDALGRLLPNYVNGIYDDYFADIQSESYLDLYPKEKLVYLTPHTNHELHTFNHDDIYIIGAFVDKGLGAKASLAKAKENNLRMAKFPLDRYLIWKQGTKSLPLNIVLSVLLDMAFYNDWNKALKNLPTRCLSEY